MRQLVPFSVVSWRGRNKEAPPACKQKNPEGEVERRIDRKKGTSDGEEESRRSGREATCSPFRSLLAWTQ